MKTSDKPLLSHFAADLPAGLVVFLVAIPLCLGIALASGAPLFSGIITGVIGGVLVGAMSGSHTSVSGPAAGLTIIVLSAIEELGTFELFLSTVVIAGVLQIIMGALKAGIIGAFFPNSVIRGMLAAIGLTLILKQIPHFFGIDSDWFGDFNFIEPDGENTITRLGSIWENMHIGAWIIGSISLLIMVLWEQPFIRRKKFLKIIPGALLAVLVSVLINVIFFQQHDALRVDASHLVALPNILEAGVFEQSFRFPDFSALNTPLVWKTAFVIALIASLETLLSVEAVDKLDPHKRTTPKNRELIAQGTGNILAGLIGGIPMTAVIVRSSANLDAGNETKMSAIYHGIILVIAAFFIPQLLNYIPLASLAAILLLVGYKLSRPVLYKNMWKDGYTVFIPFIATVIVVLFSDLLTGIMVGLGIGIFFLLRENYRYPYHIEKEGDTTSDNERYIIHLSEHVSFINKPSLQHALNEIPEGSTLVIDGSKTKAISHDVRVALKEFVVVAQEKSIHLTFLALDIPH
jgi:MFS superfamily sulfate permease-like transporter